MISKTIKDDYDGYSPGKWVDSSVAGKAVQARSAGEGDNDDLPSTIKKNDSDAKVDQKKNDKINPLEKENVDVEFSEGNNSKCSIQ